MPSRDSHAYELIDCLADEVADRYRRGERPSLQEYLDRYPQYAEDIRELLPAMLEIEQAKLHLEAEHTGVAAPPIQQLGDYHLLREVGRGGMGVVYEAEQLSLGRRVALKILPGNLFPDTRQRRRFEREARAAGRLHHTNIVPIFGVGEYEGVPYYVMQFIQGLGLDAVINEVVRQRSESDPQADQDSHSERRSVSRDPALSELARSLVTGEFRTGPEVTSDPLAPAAGVAEATSPTATPPTTTSLSSSDVIPGSVDRKPSYWRSVARIGMEAASALEYAHKQGVLHRDIKPGNLLLDTRGTVWVTDFGLAKAEGTDNITRTGDILGTLRYMPPEAFEGRSDPRSDIYALGLTLYELLALRPAFAERERNQLIKQVMAGEPPRLQRLDRTIPRDLATIIHKAIEKDIEQRYSTAEELRADLQRFLEDEPIRARRLSIPERMRRWTRRNPAVATLAAALSATLLIGTMISWVFALHARANELKATWKQREADEAREEMAQEKQRAEKATEQASAARNEAEEHLYYAQMNLAASSVAQAGGVRYAQDLLDGWMPREGRPDRRGWEWYYLRGLREEQVVAQFQDKASSMALACSPNGDVLACASLDQAIHIRKASDLQLVCSLEGHSGAIHGLSWNPEGTDLASSSSDGTVRVWNIEKRECTATLKGSGPLRQVAWSPDGRWIAAGGDPGLRVWDSKTLRQIAGQGLNGKQDINFSRIIALTWSPDGQHLAWLTGTPRVKIYRVSTQSLVRTIQPDPGLVLFSIDWSPDGSRLAVGSGYFPFQVMVCNADGSGTPLRLHGHQHKIKSVAWSPDGKFVASGSDDGTLRLWDAKTGKAVSSFPPHSGFIRSVCWHPDRRRIFSGGSDGRIIALDARRKFALHTHWAHDGGRIWYSTVDPRGQYVAGVTLKNDVRIWEANSGRLLSSWKYPIGRSQILTARFSPDGQFLAVLDSATIRIWNWKSARPELVAQHPQGTQPRARALAWSPDGKRLAFTRSIEKRLIIWNLARNQMREYVLSSSLARDGLDWHPDGRSLAFAIDVGVCVIDPETGQRQHLLRSPGLGSPRSVRWSPDGTALASAGDDSFISIWDRNSGKLLQSLRGHTGIVWSISWSPDGRQIVSGGVEGLNKIWDVASGREVVSLPRRTGGETCVNWLSDGLRIFSNSGHPELEVWDASPGYAAENPASLLEVLNRRLALSPDNIQDRLQRVQLFDRLGSREEAKRERAQLLQLLARQVNEFPQDDYPAVVYADLLQSQMRQEPPFVVAHLWGSRSIRIPALKLIEGDFNFALEWLRPLVAQNDKDRPVEWLLFALALAKSGDPGAARPWLERWQSWAKSNPFDGPHQVLARLVLTTVTGCSTDEANRQLRSLAQSTKMLAPQTSEADQKRALDETVRAAVQRKNWKAVADSLNQLIQVDPANREHWYRGAIVQAYMENRAEYLRLRQGMYERFQTTSDPLIASRLAKVWLLLPGDSSRAKETANWVDFTLQREPNNPWYQFNQALVEYRAERWEATESRLKKSLATPKLAAVIRVPSLHLLAVAQLRQDRPAEAWVSLFEARELLPSLNTATSTKSWHDWLVAHLLCREVETIFENDWNCTAQP